MLEAFIMSEVNLYASQIVQNLLIFEGKCNSNLPIKKYSKKLHICFPIRLNKVLLI